MSRWASEFDKHPFQITWAAIKDDLAILEVDDQTIPTSVQELARLKRVIAYLDEIIKSVDPELTPKTVWANFQPQADACLAQVKAYATDKNIAHITAANDHVDNLLSYVKPYIVLPQDVIAALQQSARTYVKEIERYAAAFGERSALLTRELEDNQIKSTEYLSITATNTKKIDSFTQSLFVGTGDTPSLEDQVSNLKIDIDAKAAAIQALYTTLLAGDTSTQATVVKAEKEIVEHENRIKALLDAANVRIAELGSFHAKIFGVKDPATGKPAGGLEFELDERTAQLTKFELDQNAKHDALFKKIEGLLPGATSAGLASEYKTLRRYFSRPVKIYTQLFYGSLFALVLAAVYMSVKQITLYPTMSLTLVDVGDWDFVLKALLYKVPFAAPIIWLAVFASTRRSQYERLQQEYAHKQALAASYESYKTQLQQLKGDTDALQKDLISKAIEAIAYNASATLDKKHGDKMPVHELLDKLTMDEAKKLAEKLSEWTKRAP